MCTLIAAVQAWPDAPLVIAANRDEFLARPATPPFLRPGSASAGVPRILAPRDELAGGTWLALNDRALFVGITNRAGPPPDPARRSRGALVMDAARARSAASLHAELASLDPATYNPFHLFYADRETAHLTWSDGTRLHRSDLDPGVHIVTEQSLARAEPARARRIRDRWAREIAGHPLDLERLRALLVEHAEDPFAGTCVHLDARGYGTRSSLLLALGRSWDTAELRWAEGRPCETPFAVRPDLIELLRAGAPSRRA